jgi:hypothetical protein
MREEIESKIKEIANECVSKFDSKKLKNGFLAGKCGVSYFLFEAYNHFDDALYFKKAEAILYEVLHSLTAGKNKKNISTSSICDGVSGIYFFLQILLEIGIVTKNELSFIKKATPYLVDSMEKETRRNNFDLLHGGIGIYLYLCKSYENGFITKEQHVINTNKFVKALELNLKYSNEFGIFFISEFESNRKNSVNLGMAHGLASIIQILCLIKLNKENKKETIKSVDNILAGISYFYNKLYLKFLEKPNTDYVFPFLFSFDGKHENGGRLAWCYGDLTIALALLNSGIVLNDEIIYKSGLDIAYRCMSITDIEFARIEDAGFCHGSIGLVLISDLLTQKDSSIDNKKFRNYWLEYSLKQACHADGIAGYKSSAMNLNNERSWLKEYCLLDGVSGIGSAYISLLESQHPSWFKSLALF